MRWCWWMVFVTVGCTSATPTKDIDATFDVKSNEDGSVVLTLQLLDASDPANPQAYALTPSEGARVDFRGQTIPLVAGTSEQFGAAYIARVTPAPALAADESLVATFDRGGSDRSTLEITATPDFTLVAPSTTPQPVTITWSPTGPDSMLWQATTSCVPDELDGPIPQDVGRIDFPPGVLGPAMPSTPCDVQLLFERSRGAAGSSRLRSALAYFSRTHWVQLQVTP